MSEILENKDNQDQLPTNGETFVATSPPLASQTPVTPPPLMEMVRCGSCGLENPSSASFCKGCGAKLTTGGSAQFRPAQYPRAKRLNRLFASILDGLVGFAALIPGIILVAVSPAVGLLLAVIGVIWMFFYCYTKDGWNGGRSYGKRACGLMVVYLTTNTPCTKGQSAIRQVVYTLGQISGIVGFIYMLSPQTAIRELSGFQSLGSIVNFAISIIECGLVLFTEHGRRMGDRMAGTQVINYQDYRP